MEEIRNTEEFELQEVENFEEESSGNGVLGKLLVTAAIGCIAGAGVFAYKKFKKIKSKKEEAQVVETEDGEVIIDVESEEVE